MFKIGRVTHRIEPEVLSRYPKLRTLFEKHPCYEIKYYSWKEIEDNLRYGSGGPLDPLLK